MAFNGILYRKSGGTLELNRSVGSFCVVESAKLEDKWQDGGVVTLVLQTTEVLTFYSGDYIIARGNRYLVCKTISEYRTLDDGRHQYTVPLHSPDALFKNALMYNTVEHEDGGVYSWSRPNNFIMELGSVEVLVKTCCYNVNEVMGSRVFKLGTIDASVNNEYRVINFSDRNCFAALKQTCEDFDTFYTIRVNTDETPDSDYIVDIGVEPGTFPETLQVGMRQGIAELTMDYADEDVYTQFIVLGSTENLPRAYPHERLQLDEDLAGTPPVYEGSLMVDDSKYTRWGRKRMELVFDDIKPTRPATITGLPPDNIFAFYDTSLSDIIALQPNWNPVGGTVHILDGSLMGYTFEIIAFHSGTQKITIKQISDSNGLVLPNEDEETFRFAEGMKYNLAGISLPDSYVVDAKSELKAAAVDAMEYWTRPRASFSLTPDPFFLQSNELDITCGWLIPIQHDALEINKSLRVTSVTYDLLKDTYFDLDSVEVADITGKDNFMNSVHKSTQRSLNMLRDQGIINSPTAKESNMVALLNRIALSLHLPDWETLLEMLGDGKGLFTLINEEGNDIHVVNTDLLRAGTALVNSLFANELFVSGIQSETESLLVDENGMIDFTATTSGGAPGLYVDSTKLGYWDGTAWKTYLANNGDFYLAGTSAENYLTWISAIDTLTVKGAIHALSGSIGGLTIVADKIYLGDGVYGGATTPFYVDDDGQMSLKDKFKWDGTNLTINGGGTFTGKISVGGVLIGKDAFGSGLHGIKLNDYNYWYLDGANAKVKFGGETNYISWNGTTLTQNGAAIGGGSIVGTSIDIPNATTPLFKVTAAGVVTAKSGTIGGVTIAATKMYLGTGTYGNSNTPFYVDTSNQFSLGNKLTFSSAGALSINGGGTFSGALSAATGSFAGLVDAGGIKVGAGAISAGVGGLYINANNYWDEDGNFKAGGSSSYLYWNGTTFSVKGDITGSTGTFSGVFAGSVEAGDAIFGVAAGGAGNDGLYINANNYWYDTGVFKVGSSTKYLYFDGTNATFTGALSAASGTFAGTVAIGETLKIGASVNGSNNGLFINSNNYWYGSGAFRVGDNDNYMSFGGGSATFKGALSSATGIFSGIVEAGGIKVGLAAGGTGVDGIYIDDYNYWYDSGTFRVGDSVGNKYLSYTSGGLTITGGSITSSTFYAGSSGNSVTVSANAVSSAYAGVYITSAHGTASFGDSGSVLALQLSSSTGLATITPDDITLMDETTGVAGVSIMDSGTIIVRNGSNEVVQISAGNIYLDSMPSVSGAYLSVDTAGFVHYGSGSKKIAIGTGSDANTIYFSTT